jgi:SAM-dependent methyltransferase
VSGSPEGKRATVRDGRDDPELDAGSRAHYEDPVYYTSNYRRRIDDVQYYVTVATKSGGPMLEYGVGNGRIALPVARHGVAVTGVDQSRAMLGDLRERIKLEREDVRRRITLREGDMRALRTKARFPLVICPFNTALHLYTRDDVERFLSRARAHLAPGGTFVVDLAVPSFIDLMRDPSRGFRGANFRHPTTGDIVRYAERFDYDCIRQVLFVSTDFEPVGRPDDGWMLPLAHRQFFPQEWEALLHYNGFTVDEVYGDFHGGPLTRTSDVMVWHARARTSGKR